MLNRGKKSTNRNMLKSFLQFSILFIFNVNIFDTVQCEYRDTLRIASRFRYFTTLSKTLHPWIITKLPIPVATEYRITSTERVRNCN